MDFRTQQKNLEGDHLTTTGPRIELQALGKQAQQAFKETVLAAAIEELLHHDSWDAWSLRLEHSLVDHEAYQAWQVQYDQWAQQKARRVRANFSRSDMQNP